LSNSNRNRLFQIADSQRGLFTLQQAQEAGYSSTNLTYHTKSGEWIREARGIYRLSNYPEDDQSELVLWSLWSRNRNGIPQGVYSHQTALTIYGITDLIPPKLHMTIPPEFKKQAPQELSLHYNKLRTPDIEVMRGFSVTTPLKTINDIVADQSVDDDFQRQALQNALRKGLIASRDIEQSSSEKTKYLLNALS
jgi:predicted transcriptional regulator of viral defense system